MYKAIFIDLDGTLLNDSKKISEENVKQLNRAYNEKGVISIVATGRQLGFVKKYYEDYNCSFGDIVIASNGAIIKNVKTNQYINKEIFDIKVVNNIIDIYKQEDLEYVLIYTESDAFILEKDQNIVKKLTFKPMEEFFSKDYQEEATIIILGGEIDNLQRAMKKVEIIDTLEHTPLSKYIQILKDGTIIKRDYFDIILKGCHKQNAIMKVIEELGIKHDEIIVIGDGGNDIPMFDCAGLKVAMANADEILKQSANYITDTNNNDGVAKVIKKFIFNEDV